jgi:hypothetical protein
VERELYLTTFRSMDSRLVRRQRHKVTGLQGPSALSTMWLENLVIVPTRSPCNSSHYSLNGCYKAL